MEELIQSVGNVGFPIAITIYVLVRIEKKFDILSKNIYDLSSVITRIIDKQWWWKLNFSL